jgi:mannose-binding lectin 1
LGRPTRLVIEQTENNFKVSLDNKICFQSPSIKLPIGYSLGISAASASEPDSFEVFKFVTYTEKLHPEVHGIPDPPKPPPEEGEHYPTFISHNDNKKSARDEHVNEHEFSEQKWNDMPEQEASKIDNAAQFADLHNRLQGLTRHLITTSRDLVHYQNLAAERHNLILDLLHKLESNTAPIPGIQGAMGRYENMERKMDSIAADVRQTKADIHSSLEQHVSGLRHEVRANHGSMMGAVYSGAVSFGKFALVIIGSQAITIGAYIIYKKRKGGTRQKYL